MDESTRQQLQLICENGSQSYREQAQSLLNGEVQWPVEQIAALVDSYLNEPYLTRNQNQ